MKLPLRKKALLSLAVAVCTLGAAELGLRLFGFKFMPKEIPLIIWNPEEDKQFDSLQALHRSDRYGERTSRRQHDARAEALAGRARARGRHPS